jgi:hypothetical protein
MPVTIFQRGTRAPPALAIHALMRIANRHVDPTPPDAKRDFYAIKAVTALQTIAEQALVDLGFPKEADNDA